jgi:hypothetical protein
MDLNNISNNLLLIGFALVSICCLYLLYSNFTKAREIEELKRKTEDLKKIFFNQQQHNDETYNRLMHMIGNGPSITRDILAAHNEQMTNEQINISQAESAQPVNMNNDVMNAIDTTDTNVIAAQELSNELSNEFSRKSVSPTKVITINQDQPILDNDAEIIVKREGIPDNSGYDNSNPTNETIDIKQVITLDLHELDNMDLPDDGLNGDDLNGDDILVNDLNEIDMDNGIDGLDNINGDDNLSITTDPIIEQADILGNDMNIELDLNIDELDEIEDMVNKNIDDMSEKLDSLDNLIQNESISDFDITTTTANTTTTTTKIINLDSNLELDQLLNGNANGNTANQENTKTIDLDIEHSQTNLQNMSIKQLKDLAKSHKLKATGNKNELIALLTPFYKN